MKSGRHNFAFQRVSLHVVASIKWAVIDHLNLLHQMVLFRPHHRPLQWSPWFSAVSAAGDRSECGYDLCEFAGRDEQRIKREALSDITGTREEQRDFVTFPVPQEVPCNWEWGWCAHSFSCRHSSPLHWRLLLPMCKVCNLPEQLVAWCDVSSLLSRN